MDWATRRQVTFVLHASRRRVAQRLSLIKKEFIVGARDFVLRTFALRKEEKIATGS